MFYSNYGDGRAYIARASMNGSNSQRIVEFGTKDYVTGLLIDYTGKYAGFSWILAGDCLEYLVMLSCIHTTHPAPLHLTARVTSGVPGRLDEKYMWVPIGN